jgi:hypothetical protein
MSYIRKINTYYTKTKRYIAVLGPRIAYAFNSYARTYRFNLRARWKLTLTYYDMLEHIEEMLSGDIPVILSIGPNTPLLWKNDGISFYVRESVDNQTNNADDKILLPAPDLYCYHTVKNKIHSHYVTVTGIYRNVEKNSPGEKILLRISSWGKKYYINYDEYRDYIDKSGGTFTSSMVYICSGAL